MKKPPLKHEGVEHWRCDDCPLYSTCKAVCPQVEALMAAEGIKPHIGRETIVVNSNRKAGRIRAEDYKLIADFLALAHLAQKMDQSFPPPERLDSHLSDLEVLMALNEMGYNYAEMHRDMEVNRKRAKRILEDTLDALHGMVNDLFKTT